MRELERRDLDLDQYHQQKYLYLEDIINPTKIINKKIKLMMLSILVQGNMVQVSMFQIQISDFLI